MQSNKRRNTKKHTQMIEIGHWLIGVIAGLTLLLAFGLPFQAEALDPVFVADCPNTCSDSEMIIGCDDRYRKPDDVDGATKAPWRFTGRFDGGSRCTGTLIADKFVLTAAHCMVDEGDQPITFSLAQEAENECQRPYGSYAVRRIWIPKGVVLDDDETNRALDVAVAELWNPIPGATPANWGHIAWSTLKNKQPRSVGYPANPPDGGILGSPWATGAQHFDSNQPYRWINGGEKGLLYTDLDGTGGQSGSPVYVFNNGKRKVIGVLLGSPVPACEAGQNWVARLTPEIVEHIQNVIDPQTLDFWWDVIDVPQTSDILPCDGANGLVAAPPNLSRHLAIDIESQAFSIQLDSVPHVSAVGPNFPNPFNPETWIPHANAHDGIASIQIYDVSGYLVRTLDLGHQKAGYYLDKSKAAYWDGRNKHGEIVPGGIYFYTFKLDDYQQTRKMIVVK